MNGAQSLVESLVANGVEVCFANPGTSEMHFVAALDTSPGLQTVLCLFEGVVTGAADGYARMLNQPAVTLLHLGPGLANGLSNLHNAIRAQSPIINIVGDHATYHRHYDAPLTSDIEGTARPFSHWVRTSANADRISSDAADAVAAACSLPGNVATLILPADTAWGSVRAPSVARRTPPAPGEPSDGQIEAVAAMLRSPSKTAIILGNRVADDSSLQSAGRIAQSTGARLLTATYLARVSRGAGRVPVDRIPFEIGKALELLKDFDNFILVGAKAPVAFFAYPDKPSQLTPPGARILELCRPDVDPSRALRALEESLGAHGKTCRVAELAIPALPVGAVTPEKIGELLANLLPEGAIVVDESITTGRTFLDSTQGARPHDWLLPTGGSIGYALASSIGAAIACPDRKVITLESDGSGMYMPQALWTQAREHLDIVTLIFSNRQYKILRNEMRNVGASSIGEKANKLLSIDDPTIDWVTLATSMGVEGTRAATLEQLASQLGDALAQRGPRLIEVVL